MPSPEIVVSPCISVCEINADSGFCVGCYRTAQEIGIWRMADAETRLGILRDIRGRWLAAEPPAENDEIWIERHEDLGERLELAGLIETPTD